MVAWVNSQALVKWTTEALAWARPPQGNSTATTAPTSN